MPNYSAKVDKAEYENTQIGWEGTADELALYMLIAECQCAGEDGELPVLMDLDKVGISFKSHKKFKNVFNILYIESPKQSQ